MLRIITSTASSSASASHSSMVIRPAASSAAPATPTSDGVRYPASRENTTPGPVGRPRVRVSPEVSECSRMPRRRRPARTATSAWPPSCAMVIAFRASTQAGRGTTASTASAAVASTRRCGGSGWVLHTRCQTSVTTVQGTCSLLALERPRDQIEVGQVGGPLAVGRLPVEAVRLVVVEDRAAVDDVQPGVAAVVGELPVGRLHVVGHRADADLLVPGEVAGRYPVRGLVLPVRHGVRLRLAGLVDAEQAATGRVAEVDDAVALGSGPAVGHGDGEAGAVVVVVPAGGERGARAGRRLRRGRGARRSRSAG